MRLARALGGKPTLRVKKDHPEACPEEGLPEKGGAFDKGAFSRPKEKPRNKKGALVGLKGLYKGT